MRKWVLSAIFLVSASAPAMAGFQQWSVETEDDPFSGGKRVTVDFMSTLRSGVIVICDTAETGVMFRAIPGFVFDTRLEGFAPEIEFAIDGVRLLGQSGETGAVGDNLAASQVMLTKENAESLVAAFATAKKQIAVKDGISDRPHLLTARGSTKASASLLECMKAQK